MAALVNLPFANSFTFKRPNAAPYLHAFGTFQSADADEARFDHDANGQRLGLLVEAGPSNGAHDDVQIRSGDWEVAGDATVLFEYQDAGGISMRAIYTQNVRQTVNVCLQNMGHHRTIGAVAGYLPNLGGYVKYANRNWQLGLALAAGDDQLLGDETGRIMIESA